MKQYLDALEFIINNGEEVSDRTGVGTHSVFGYQMHFNLQDGFPAVTTKKLAWHSVIGELLWFLEGSTDERRLAELTFNKDRSELINKNTIWTANANSQGVSLGYVNNDLTKQLGPVYGHQWRHFNATYENRFTDYKNKGIDQLKFIIDCLKDPEKRYSRRLIMSAWNPCQINEMALPPCHILCQFNVIGNELSCSMYQRSCDVGLGVPFNIASYAFLTHILAKHCGLIAKEFCYNMGNCHIYDDHFEQVKTQINRNPCEFPTIEIINKKENINDYTIDDFKIYDYESCEQIKGAMRA